MKKIPPHNTEAEKSVLGSAMLSKDALADVIDVVKPDDFYDAAHKEIFYRHDGPLSKQRLRRHCYSLRRSEKRESLWRW